MEVLNDLLRIKVFREARAERELAKARHQLAEARRAFREAEETLASFLEDSNQREKAMFADLCARQVLLRDIEEVRLDIALMKEQADRLAEQVDAAQQALDEASAQAEQMRLAHRDAVRMREKFDELALEARRELEDELVRFEELEMEEAAAGRHAFQGKAAADEADLSMEAEP